VRNTSIGFLALPWGEKTEDTRLVEAQRILDEDHYFWSREVTERIPRISRVASRRELEWVPILCLSVPPGVARLFSRENRSHRATGRRVFVRHVALGGFRDEAEIPRAIGARTKLLLVAGQDHTVRLK